MLKSVRRSQSGATAVEFALILVPLALVIFGIVEFGFYIYDRQIITNASRVGARFGTLQAPPPRYQLADIQAKVLAYTNGVLVHFGTQPLTVTLPTGACTKGGNKLTVHVSYPYTFLFLSTFIGQKDIVADTTMECEE
jgi:Flp pilus assembly protein TadG